MTSYLDHPPSAEDQEKVFQSATFCIYQFEHSIMCGKARMSERERLFFLAGMFTTFSYGDMMLSSCEGDLDKLKKIMQDLESETRGFAEIEIKKLHMFFCEGCSKRFGNGAEAKG